MTFAVAGGFIVGSPVAISLVTMVVTNLGSKAHDWVSSLKKKKKKKKKKIKKKKRKKKREANKYIHKWAASILQPKKKMLSSKEFCYQYEDLFPTKISGSMRRYDMRNFPMWLNHSINLGTIYVGSDPHQKKKKGKKS